MTQFDPTQLLRQDQLNIEPYAVSPVSLGDFDRILKLSANENPYGASPKVNAAFAEMRHWHRYLSQDELRPAIARYVGVDASNIVITNGADEAIDLVQRIFLSPGDAIVDCPPAFEMYAAFAGANGARVINAPRRDDFSLDVEAIESVIASDKVAQQSPIRDSEIAAPSNPKLIFVTNPSNPDGTLATPEQIERLLALPAIIVLDEAYAEFSGVSYAARVPTQPNLIILRTFSKWAGLAGLRIGYAIAPTPIADLLMRVKSPYNMNAAAILAASVSLDDADYLMANVRRILVERARLFAELARLEFLQPLPSHANYLLCRVIGRDAKQIRSALAARGIMIRMFALPRLQDYIRISVGTPEQDAVLLNALKEIGA